MAMGGDVIARAKGMQYERNLNRCSPKRYITTYQSGNSGQEELELSQPFVQKV